MRPRIEPFDPKLLWLGLLAFAALAVIAVGVGFLQRYRADLMDDADPREGVLDALREAHEAGELSDEEYRKAQDALDHGERGAEGSLPHVPRF